MHAPRDETVGIDNATRIFTAAKHPKSFVSLDTADHLLSRRADAEYAADIIAAWAGRFVAAVGEGEAARAPGPVTVSETGEGKFQQQVVSGRHTLYADEPENAGGLDSGPSPYDYLAIALGACTSMTLRLYAERKKLPLEHVEVEVTHAKVHAKDCAECEEREGRLDRLERRIALAGDLSQDERARLLQIADKCPVHRTLEQSSVIVTRLKD
jgi:putative redox protein